MKILCARYLAVAALAVSLASCGGTREPGENNTVSANAADNTARNERDRAEVAQTPLDQSENQADLDISANIRKSVVDDDTLSTNAHNVKIITSGGVVTLRGPVKSAQEKATIEKKAREAAGVQRVENLLEIE